MIYLAGKIIKELTKEEYGISIDNIERMIELVRKCDFQIISKNDKEIHNLFKIDGEDYIIEYVEENLGNSHLLLYPPISLDGKFHFVNPIINIQGHENLSAKYHELSHLLSIGNWKYDDEKRIMKRTEGTLIHRYRYNNDEIIDLNLRRKREEILIDEKINDIIAYYLLEKLENEKDIEIRENKYINKQIRDFINKKYKNNIKKFIGDYFSCKLTELSREIEFGENR